MLRYITMRLRRSRQKIYFVCIIAMILVIALTFCDNDPGEKATYSLGDTGPGGGIIFYVSEEGFTVEGYSGSTGSFGTYTSHYLETAPSNVAGTKSWVASTDIFFEELIPNMETIVSAYELPETTLNSSIGKGRKNTAIINDQAYETPAATACVTYRSPSDNRLTDWFLPSIGELNELYKQKNLIGILTDIPSDIKTKSFWSSSQSDGRAAWLQFFDDGYQGGNISKKVTANIRAVRAF